MSTLSEQNKKETYQGEGLRNSQERNATFNHVAQKWIQDGTVSFESMLDTAKEFQKQCFDIEDTRMSDITFENTGSGINVKVAGHIYKVSENAWTQFANLLGIPPGYLSKLRDMQEFDLVRNNLETMMNCRLNDDSEKGDRTNFLRLKNSPGSVPIIRAVLSDRYAALNTLPLIEILSDTVPGGRVSHLKYDGDTFRANILIPDTIRSESDSDYGGGISVLNNETGRFSYRQRPFVFRHICMNGCVWDRANGQEFSRVHLGKDFDWRKFRENVIMNLQKQIPLVHLGIENMLALKGIPLSQQEIESAIVHVSKGEIMSAALSQEWYKGFKTELEASNGASGILSAFGVVQGLTRAAHAPEAGLEVQELMESLSGRLVAGNWDKLMTASRLVEREQVAKVLALTA